MSSKQEVAAPSRPSNAELQEQYNTFKESIAQLSSKIGELEADLDEHKIVLETLKTMPSDRKCFRMIGESLVESTVKDVSPNLQTNSVQLQTVIGTLNKQLEQTKDELKKWQIKYKVQIVPTH
ncbi:uncharacterized protein SAPINGB_P001234 [Magnusiomyces paraingens]|uniref:Prefoldin subunit 2 n=1 Tax=Magnusiomyces paraingens TaxID=2606893 RepID=A0A5E8B4P1_9ASCO|nr:uncharacterized protein SAPINGB_P001234 [Saprochaete ingens]VVT46480.1 unnamed protein product [Saprochaete ingens]